MKKIKQAVLLCGGLGTRLRPYTYKMSKQMIPILGNPLTEWNIVQFKKHGVTEFLINLYTKPEVMRGYLGDGAKWGVKIAYNLEQDPPGTAGSIKLFERHIDEEFFVIYGDTLSLLDYTAVEKLWREKPAEAIGMQWVQPGDKPSSDIAEMDNEGRLVAIHPKPRAKSFPNAYRMRGAMIMRRGVLPYIPSGRYYEIGRDLVPDLLSHGELFYGFESSDYSKGIDTVEAWREVEEYLKANHIRPEGLLNGRFEI